MRRLDYEVVRSFAPQRLLVKHRDYNALWHKYRSLFPCTPRWKALLEPSSGPDENKSFAHGTVRFGSIAIGCDDVSKVTATVKDGSYSVRIGDPVNVIHVDNFSGIQQLRKDLADVATFIGQNEELARKELVLGVTYRELASLAIRMGYRRMDVTEVDEDYNYDVAAAHLVFGAFSGTRNPYRLEAVYMPTEEFVPTFSRSE